MKFIFDNLSYFFGIMALNIYHVSIPPSFHMGYDTYDSFVVCAMDEDDARSTHPQSDRWVYNYEKECWYDGHIRTAGTTKYNKNGWVYGKEVDSLIVEHIGVALPSMKECVILTSCYRMYIYILMMFYHLLYQTDMKLQYRYRCYSTIKRVLYNFQKIVRRTLYVV